MGWVSGSFSSEKMCLTRFSPIVVVRGRVKMRGTFLWSLIVSLMSSCYSTALVDAQKTKPDVEQDVLATIKKDYPGAIIPKYLNAKLCGSEKKEHPGWVTADFNGDGLSDHAVLFEVPSKEEPTGMGKGYDFNLVVLWQEKPGVYKTQLLRRIFENSIYGSPPDFATPTLKELMTTWIYIEKQSPGKLRESPVVGNRTVILQNPGIELVYCEKSSSVFYWDKKANRFEELVTSD